MSYLDKDLQRSYQREWAAERRRVFMLDKKCESCGSTDALIVSGRSGNKDSKNYMPSVYIASEKAQVKLMKKLHILCRKCSYKDKKYWNAQRTVKRNKARILLKHRVLDKAKELGIAHFII